MLHAIIMAGGVGTRLWPVSTKRRPKQILPLFGSKTLLKLTYERLRRGMAADYLWITTSKENFSAVRHQLPHVPLSRYSIESHRRETAPALALALSKLIAHDPNAAFVYVNADNVIKDVPGFHRTLRRAEAIVRRNPERVVLVGVKPDYPETGYGYIRIGRKIRDGNTVSAFKEKPDLATARRFVASGAYLWNPTLIVARAAHMLHLFEQHLPGVMRHVARGHFHRSPSIDINRGILEKEKGMLVISADFDWTDVGSWRSMYEALARRPDENVVRGRHLGIDSRGNLLFSDSKKLFATVGIQDMIIVETPEAILALPKSRAQEVKNLVNLLDTPRLRKYK